MSKIIFIGDSITQGVRTGVVEQDTFAYKVKQSRGFSEYLNKGKPNDTADGGLSRFNVDVIAHSPKSVVIKFGTNDVFYDKPVSVYKESIRGMIQLSKMNNIEVVVLSPFFGRSSAQINKFPPYLAALAEVCKEENVPLIEIYRRVTHSYFIMTSTQFNELYLDWAHPSKKGQEYIANIILENINNNLLLP